MSGPTVAIVGSTRGQVLSQGVDPADVQDAARIIGRELAATGCRIIVYSSDRSFVEPYFVEGFQSEGQLPKKSIICIANDDHPIQYEGMTDPNGPFESRIDTHKDWEVGFYESLKSDAEAVLLIGGDTSARNDHRDRACRWIRYRVLIPDPAAPG